jgi:hypothetical protein
MTLQLQILTARIAELTTSDREWRRDSDISMGELIEADTMIRQRLEEVVTTTDARLNDHEDKISLLTMMLSDLQRQVNTPESHFNPPDIAIPAYPTGHSSPSTNASHSSEREKWFNKPRELLRETLSSSSGIVEMPVASAVARSVSATGMMSRTQSPVAGPSQEKLFLPAVDSPTSVTTDPGQHQRYFTRASQRSTSDYSKLTAEPLNLNRNSGKGKGKGSGKDTDDE